MYVSSKKALTCANLSARNIIRSGNEGKNLKNSIILGKLQLHTTTLRPNYAATAVLPLPENIDASECTHFSPQRSRDITGDVITSKYAQISKWRPTIDITTDNSSNMSKTISSPFNGAYDARLQSYDCFGAVSLSSVMQTNVPEPYAGMKKFSHLNMPGGQWSQEGKFISQDLQSSHYQELRNKARSAWVSYDQNATINQKACSHQISKNILARGITTTNFLKPQLVENVKSRSLCSKAEAKDTPKVELSKRERFKRAIKEYGATIFVFHITISLASLGGFYALVSSGIDMMPVLEYLGLTSTTLSNKIASGASTFVVAYAVHKVFAPVRLSITLGAAPIIVRYLRSKGFLKPKIIKQK